MAFVGIGIYHLDLAFLDINEAIRRVAGPRDKRTLGIVGYLAQTTQCFDVRRGEWGALHLA